MPKVVSSTVQIFYLQETEIVSDPAVYQSGTTVSLSPTFANANQYAWSSWICKTSWSGDWESFFRISLNASYQLLIWTNLKNLKFSTDFGLGRIAGSVMKGTEKTIFLSSITTDTNSKWEFEAPVTMFKLFLIHNDENSLECCHDIAAIKHLGFSRSGHWFFDKHWVWISIYVGN